MADVSDDQKKMYLDIYYAINFIRKVQHNKPSKEKVFSLLKKLNRHCSYNLFNIDMDQLVKDKGDVLKTTMTRNLCFLLKSLMNSLVFILRQQIATPKQKTDNIHPGNDESAKESDKSLSDLEQFFDNVTLHKAAHKAPDSMLLFEQMISNLQSETLFLKEHLKSKDIYFNGEILYFRNQLNDCLHRIQIKCDDSDFLSCVNKLNLLQNLNSSLNIPSRELNLIEDLNELNKNVQYYINKENNVCQKIGNFIDDKVNKNATTDEDKTDLNNSNDISGTSYKRRSGKDDTRRKKITQ